MKKKIFSVLLLIFCFTAIYAGNNIGDITIESMPKSYSKSLFMYFDTYGFLDEFEYYEITVDDEGTYRLILASPAYPLSEVKVIVQEDYVEFFTWDDFDIRTGANKILKAVNTANLEYYSFVKFYYDEEDICACVDVSTLGYPGESILDQLERFISITADAFSEIEEKLL